MDQQGILCDLRLDCGYLSQPCLLVNVHSGEGETLHLIQKIKVLYQNKIDWSAIDIPQYVCENCIKKLNNIFGDDDDDHDNDADEKIYDYEDTEDSDVDSVDYDNYDYDSDENLQDIANDHQNAIMHMNLNILSVPRGSMSRG